MDNNYRFDIRNKETFISDIKRGSLAEAQIVIRYGILEYKETGKWPDIKPNGCDFTGTYISNNRKITSQPDFLVNDQLIEITRADTLCKRYFHIKVSKVEKCVKDKFNFMFVNGFSILKEPKFILLDSLEIQKATDYSIKTYGGTVPHPGAGKTGVINKDAYRYNLDWFDNWTVLPVLVNSIPKQYKDILAMVSNAKAN